MSNYAKGCGHMADNKEYVCGDCAHALRKRNEADAKLVEELCDWAEDTDDPTATSTKLVTRGRALARRLRGGEG